MVLHTVPHSSSGFQLCPPFLTRQRMEMSCRLTFFPYGFVWLACQANGKQIRLSPTADCSSKTTKTTTTKNHQHFCGWAVKCDGSRDFFRLIIWCVTEENVDFRIYQEWSWGGSFQLVFCLDLRSWIPWTHRRFSCVHLRDWKVVLPKQSLTSVFQRVLATFGWWRCFRNAPQSFESQMIGWKATYEKRDAWYVVLPLPWH